MCADAQATPPHAEEASKQPAGRGKGERGLPGSTHVLSGDPAVADGSAPNKPPVDTASERVVKVLFSCKHMHGHTCTHARRPTGGSHQGTMAYVARGTCHVGWSS